MVYYPCPSDAALKYTVTALRVRFGSYAVRELSEVPLSCNGCVMLLKDSSVCCILVIALYLTPE
jgi:hypothetical protein